MLQLLSTNGHQSNTPIPIRVWEAIRSYMARSKTWVIPTKSNECSDFLNYVLCPYILRLMHFIFGTQFPLDGGSQNKRTLSRSTTLITRVRLTQKHTSTNIAATVSISNSMLYVLRAALTFIGNVVTVAARSHVVQLTMLTQAWNGTHLHMRERFIRIVWSRVQSHTIPFIHHPFVGGHECEKYSTERDFFRLDFLLECRRDTLVTIYAKSSRDSAISGRCEKAKVKLN